MERLLLKLQSLRTDGKFTVSVVVVDNDSNESARDIVARVPPASLAIAYEVEPERSISHARNRSVRNATGDLVAFIDDDEFPEENWLLEHYRALVSLNVDGVLGPVKPHFENKPPLWLIKSGLLDRPTLNTGNIITDSRYTRTGNVLLWRRVFNGLAAPFDPSYGRTGGGDAVFFRRMMNQGFVFAWCNEGVVYETVPPERQTRTYHVQRAFTRGITSAWKSKLLSTDTVRSIFAIMVYTAALPFLAMFTHHLFVRYLVKNCDHLAKVLCLLGLRIVVERPY